MTKFEGCYLTNAGREMVHSTGLGRLTFTRAETGDGTYTSKEDILEITLLKAKKQDFGLDGFTEGENCTVNVKFTLRNKGLTSGYQLSEIGIYAKGDDGEEKLYCVAFALPENTEEVPADDNGSIAYVTSVNIETVVSTDCEVTVTYSEDHEWTINYVEGVVGKVLVKTKDYSDTLYQRATEYTNQSYQKSIDHTDQRITDLIDGAPGFRNTLRKLSDAIDGNESETNALIEALAQQVVNNAKTAKDYTDTNYQQATGYTDQKIADLINGAPSTLDTLGEIAKAMKKDEDVVKALEEAIGKKANQAEMESLLGLKLDATGDSGNTTVKYTSTLNKN